MNKKKFRLKLLCKLIKCGKFCFSEMFSCKTYKKAVLNYFVTQTLSNSIDLRNLQKQSDFFQTRNKIFTPL